MKKGFKRIGALLLAVTTLFALAVPAMAADMGANGTVETSANTVTLKKAITVTNHYGSEGVYAYEPTITYTYTLGNGSTGGQVTDTTPITAQFKAGQTSYLASGDAVSKTAVFSSANAVATNGSAVTKDISWTFNPSAFPSAGVYRFTVTESATSVAPASIGIERDASYDTTKFLDVYVKNGTNGLEIYGYALVDDEASAVTSASSKSQGWNADKSGDGGHNDLETYDTYNLTVTKEITGSGADMTAEFPFQVALSGEMSSANIATEGTGASISAWSFTDGAPDTAAINGTLGHEETLIIKGLPNVVSFGVTEDNPTVDKYQATATISGATATTLANGEDLVASETGQSLVAGAATFTDAISVDAENVLDAISPTGIVLRLAPYALILGAGIVFFALSRRRKSEEC